MPSTSSSEEFVFALQKLIEGHVAYIVKQEAEETSRRIEARIKQDIEKIQTKVLQWHNFAQWENNWQVTVSVPPEFLAKNTK